MHPIALEHRSLRTMVNRLSLFVNRDTCLCSIWMKKCHCAASEINVASESSRTLAYRPLSCCPDKSQRCVAGPQAEDTKGARDGHSVSGPWSPKNMFIVQVGSYCCVGYKCMLCAQFHRKSRKDITLYTQDTGKMSALCPSGAVPGRDR